MILGGVKTERHNDAIIKTFVINNKTKKEPNREKETAPPQIKTEKMVNQLTTTFQSN